MLQLLRYQLRSMRGKSSIVLAKCPSYAIENNVETTYFPPWDQENFISSSKTALSYEVIQVIGIIGGEETTTEIVSDEDNYAKVNCLTDNNYGSVEFVYTYADILKYVNFKDITTRVDDNPGKCAFIMFYGKWCKYSRLAAPHVKALARAFPQLHVLAMEVSKFRDFSEKYGIYNVPTLVFVSDGYFVAEYNYMPNIEGLSEFVSVLSNLKANGSLELTAADKKVPEFNFNRKIDHDRR